MTRYFRDTVREPGREICWRLNDDDSVQHRWEWETDWNKSSASLFQSSDDLNVNLSTGSIEEIDYDPFTESKCQFTGKPDYDC